MARYAIGDVQGCHDELQALAARLRFNPDRDQLWFVGDLVNRGPKSLEVLRWVRSLGAAAICVLGNHDLHLLALGLGLRKSRGTGDTLDAVLQAPDRASLLDWLIQRPLIYRDPPATPRRCLLVHAGVLPLWSSDEALALGGEVEQALRSNPDHFFAHLYGNEPSQWRDDLQGPDRLRFTVNVLTRMRFCTADGRVDLKLKGPPDSASEPWHPWFELPTREPRRERIVCGHWSALGLQLRSGLASLDTGCVWGEALTALDLDSQAPPVSVSCRARAAD